MERLTKTCSSKTHIYQKYSATVLSVTTFFLGVVMSEHALGSFVVAPSKSCFRQEQATVFPERDNPKTESLLFSHPQKVVKDILSSGLDSDKALRILYNAYPYLESDSLLSTGPATAFHYLVIDSRSIATIFDILKKLQNMTVAIQLLERTIQVYHWNKHISLDSDLNNKDEFLLRSVYKSFISLTAHMKRGDWIQHIITTHMPVYAGLAPSLDMMHAALSAFGKCDRFDLVLEWLEKMEKEEIVQPSLYENEPKEMAERERHDIRFGTPLQNFTVPAPDRLAYQTASSAFSNVRRGSEAASILRRMQVIGGFKPDLRSYNQILAAFSRDGNDPNRVFEAMQVLNAMEEDPNITPNDASYEMVISICMRENEWDEAARIIRRLEGSSDPSVSNTVTDARDAFHANEKKVSRYIDQMTRYTKIGSGRESWYQLGIYRSQNYDLSISFGFQIHRNPGSNGLSFVFYDQETSDKLGFILVRHTVEQKQSHGNSLLFSDLMGMYVEDKMRGKGLANIFLAIWLKVLVTADILPRTEVINKPLLSLVLTRFGFIPRQGGFEVIVSPMATENETKSLFTLYSPTLKHLNGIFGERERRVQRMCISSTPPEQGGKRTFVKTFFDHPWTIYSIQQAHDSEAASSDDVEGQDKRWICLALLQEMINQTLTGSIEILYTLDELKFALFGFMIEI